MLKSPLHVYGVSCGVWVCVCVYVYLSVYLSPCQHIVTRKQCCFSTAVYLFIFLCCPGGWYCFDQNSCQGRWLNNPNLMSSTRWPLTRRGKCLMLKSLCQHPFIRPFVCSYNHRPSVHPSIHPPIHRSVFTSIHPSIHPLINSFILAFIHSLIHSLKELSICFICLFILF